MAYIGNIPAEAYISISSQTFTTINGTGYTLSSSVESSEDIALFLNNVRQKPSTYTATGTALTMGTATTTADELYCVYLGKALQTVNPGADSVGTSQIADLAVTNAKVADDAVGLDELSATGTPSASNYLRGDNSWAAVAADTNDKVSVSANDTTPSYLNGKLVAGTNISLTEGNDGGDETLTAAFTGSLNASVLNAGTVATARLGTGTASSSTVLYGDQTYKAAPSGKVKQIVRADATGKTADNTNYSSAAGGTIGDIGTAHITIAFTPTSATSIIYVSASAGGGTESNTSNGSAIFGGSTCRAWFNNNGYSVDASGHSLHASWVSGSTSALDIEFRTIGSYIGSNTTLGNMHGTGDATAPYGTMTVMEIEP
jgi:hypothetical protein